MKKPPPAEKTTTPILVAGKNCWVADAKVKDAGLLVDGEDYYRAFHQAALKAKHHILIAGWHFTTGVRLLRGDDGDVSLLDFLEQLCAKNSELRIYILAWNFSINYAIEWESNQKEMFEAVGQGRIDFRFDGVHAVGASHHQKLVVVDGKVAFVGGMDFSAGTWDNREHLPHDPKRDDPDQEPHTPYHDIQAYCSGPAVQELVTYFQTRWKTATDEELIVKEVAGPTTTLKPTLRLPPSPVAFSLNRPETTKEPEAILEIYQLYLDSIAAAERLIYIENQYLTSSDVAKALCDRMEQADRPQLDIVIVLPCDFHSWIEAAALGPPQLTAVDQVTEAAKRTGHRLGLYYAAAQSGKEEIQVFIHSKLMIVDDRFLTVGSCNTSNRSMGKDTELNISWEAAGTDAETLANAIRDVRVNLLAEHCGLLKEPKRQGHLREMEGIVERLNHECEQGTCRLRILDTEKMQKKRPWLRTLEWFGIFFDPGEVAKKA